MAERMFLGTLMMITRYVVLGTGLSLLTGCALSYISPDCPETLIPDYSSEVTVGQMERAAVRGVLGAPQFSSSYWGFDLFRADTEQAEVVFAITPWPIPFARLKDQFHRYTLVAYDANGRASALGSGLFRRPSSWRKASPIRQDFRSLQLRAGELMFFVDPEGQEVNLLVSPPGRDAFLEHARSSNDCTVVLGCGDRGCADQLSVDAGPVRRLPVRTPSVIWYREGERDSWLQGIEPYSTPWLEAIVAIKIAAGEHTLEFSAKHLGGRTSVKVVCRPGEVNYLVVSATSKESFWPTLVDWQITQSDTMPDCFARHPLVLLDDGQWYIDADLSE